MMPNDIENPDAGISAPPPFNPADFLTQLGIALSIMSQRDPAKATQLYMGLQESQRRKQQQMMLMQKLQQEQAGHARQLQGAKTLQKMFQPTLAPGVEGPEPQFDTQQAIIAALQADPSGGVAKLLSSEPFLNIMRQAGRMETAGPLQAKTAQQAEAAYGTVPLQPGEERTFAPTGVTVKRQTPINPQQLQAFAAQTGGGTPQEQYQRMQDQEMANLQKQVDLFGGGGAPMAGSPALGASPQGAMELKSVELSSGAAPQMTIGKRGVDEAVKDEFPRTAKSLGYDPRNLTPEQIEHTKQVLRGEKRSDEIGTFKEKELFTRSLPAPESPGERKERIEGQATVEEYHNLGQLFKPEFVGPVAGRMLEQRYKFGRDVTLRSITPEEANFAAVNEKLANTVIHQLSGAAVTPSEQKRIIRSIPQLTDPPTVWQSKYQQSLKNIEYLNSLRQQTAPSSSRPPVTPVAPKTSGGTAKDVLKLMGIE